MSAASPLVRLEADWDTSQLLDQTPGGFGIWDGVRFTVDPVRDCDYLVMLNNRKFAPVTAVCSRENVWALMQEPWLPGLYDWLREGHEPFARVYSHLAVTTAGKYVPAHLAIPSHTGLTYDEQIAATMPQKTAGISWITSNLEFLPGHRRRNVLRARLDAMPSPLVDVYGRGIRPVARKWDALAPYRYSLAIENASGPNLWTEKVADCFLSWTIPIYHGCTNLEEYFPADSFIRIDATEPEAAIARIREVLAGDNWERRLPALEMARRLVLEKYAFFPFLANAIKQDRRPPGPKVEVTIPGFRWKRWRYLGRYAKLRYVTRELPPAEGADLRSMLLDKWDQLRRSLRRK